MTCVYTSVGGGKAARVVSIWMLVLATSAGSLPARPIVLQHATGNTKFVLDTKHGNLAAASLAGRAVLSACFDEYWSQADDGSFQARSSELEDEVVGVNTAAGRIEFSCRNAALGLSLTKVYTFGPVASSLRKTVLLRPYSRRQIVHILSRVRLADAFAKSASLYTPRQSWLGRTLLYGVRKLADIREPVTSTSGWDNRFVVAFQPDRSVAVSHWLSQVDGLWVPCSGAVAEWGKESPAALTYFPDGWRFRTLLAAENQATSASVDYVLHTGDWYDAWRLYRCLPGLKQAYAHLDAMPAWPQKIKYGSFWNPPWYTDYADATKKLCERLGPDAFFTIGVFGWSLDGDHETDRPFMTEGLSLVLTPEYFSRCVAALQEHPRAKVGLYIQGGLIDSESDLYRTHPDWVFRDAAGQPIDSGFADNPIGRLYIANPRREEWVRHQLARVQAVCHRYNCGFIYCDGGGYFELVDWADRQVVNFADCRRLNERFLEAVRATGKDRALLINSQNAPFADLSWLECPYFAPAMPWPDTVDFCFDTKCMSDPRYTLEPLYWSDNDRYLAMCIAFGLTPCGDVSPERPEATWRAIETSYRMKRAQLIFDSSATTPVWWRDGVPIVTFAQRLGKEVIVPVLNFSDREDVTVQVDLAAVGLQNAGPILATASQPLLSASVETLSGKRTKPNRLAFKIKVPNSWRGVTLLTLAPSKR